MRSFVSKIMQSRGNSVFLVLATCNKKPAWYFVRVPPEKTQNFKQAMAINAADIGAYGEILKRGWGEEPPQDIVDYMIEFHGYIP